MKICVGRTGHQIADTVAQSLIKGFGHYSQGDVFIGYGILRGMAESFRKYEHWFNVDRGFWKPSHYDGYYRISYKGTQATSNWPVPDYDRLDRLKLDIKPWRGFDESKPILVCPPTEHVAMFFNIQDWLMNIQKPNMNIHLRQKGDPNPINFHDYNYVLTFNSSVGWQALQAGIPCVSDPTFSMVGSWYNKIGLEDLSEKQYATRNELFATMAASQFTLQEIEEGKAWSLIASSISLLATMAGKQSPQMSQPTQSAEGLKARFQSNT